MKTNAVWFRLAASAILLTSSAPPLYGQVNMTGEASARLADERFVRAVKEKTQGKNFNSLDLTSLANKAREAELEKARAAHRRCMEACDNAHPFVPYAPRNRELARMSSLRSCKASCPGSPSGSVIAATPE